MKIQINTNTFQSIIKKFKNVKLKNEFQKSVLIVADDQVKIYVNNLSVQMEATVSGTILEPGIVCIPEETLKILEHFKDDFLTIDDNCITHDTRELNFIPAPANEYQYFRDIVSDRIFTITERELTHLLTVSYSITTDEARPIYEGILISEGQFIGLSQYNVAIRKGSFITSDQFIISRETWQTLKRTSKRNDNLVNVYKNDDFVTFKFEDVELTGKLLHGKFLNVSDLLKESPETIVTVEGNALIESMKIIDKLKAEYVKLTIKDNLLVLESETGNNKLIETVQCKTNYVGFEIFLDPKLLNNAIKQYKNDNVTLNFTGSTSPVVIKADNKIEIVLPMRVE